MLETPDTPGRERRALALFGDIEAVALSEERVRDENDLEGRIAQITQSAVSSLVYNRIPDSAALAKHLARSETARTPPSMKAAVASFDPRSTERALQTGAGNCLGIAEVLHASLRNAGLHATIMLGWDRTARFVTWGRPNHVSVGIPVWSAGKLNGVFLVDASFGLVVPVYVRKATTTLVDGVGAFAWIETAAAAYVAWMNLDGVELRRIFLASGKELERDLIVPFLAMDANPASAVWQGPYNPTDLLVVDLDGRHVFGQTLGKRITVPFVDLPMKTDLLAPYADAVQMPEAALEECLETIVVEQERLALLRTAARAPYL